MKQNAAGTRALCRIPGDAECMLKQVSVFLLHSGYILQKLRERERERERESHPHAVYQRKLCRKFYILLGN
jgi:hypothetical protein